MIDGGEIIKLKNKAVLPPHIKKEVDDLKGAY